MTDSEKKTISGSGLFYESEWLYVTKEGDLYVKKTSFTGEQKLTTLESGEFEEQAEKYREKLARLDKKVEVFAEGWKDKGAEKTVDDKSVSEQIGQQLPGHVAVEEVDLLAGKLEELFSRLKPGQFEQEANETGTDQETEVGVDERSTSGNDKQEEEKVADRKPPQEIDPKRASHLESGEQGKRIEKDESKHVPGGHVDDQVEDIEKAERQKPVKGPDEHGEMEAGGEEGKQMESEQAAEPVESEQEPQVEKEGDADSEHYYEKLSKKAEQLVALTDWSYVTAEFANLDALWSEGPDPGGTDITPFRERINKARETFEQKKEAHYQEQKKIRQANLDKKSELLEELANIIAEENWTATKKVSRIRHKWDQLKLLPADKGEELQKAFNRLIRTFEDHKVDRIVKKKQREEENLTGKLVVLDKMEALLKELEKSNDKEWPPAEGELKKLNRQWRKIGRVPAEKNQEMWDRYHQIQDRFHQLRFEKDKKYRNRIEKYLSKKKQLIKEAEALMDEDDLAEAARKVNKLHRRWKKIGNLPQKDENELWDQFKEATDAFNRKKSENIDELREQEEQNLEQKKELIRQAEELKDSREWDSTHDNLQQLMKKWKTAGPVPKKISGKIWKQFKGAMDVFYERRRDHFKEIREQRKGNLEEKQEILEKLKTLKDHEDPIKAVEEAKPLQEEFKNAGYVPIKHKNRMWKEYRETCDVIYDRYRAAKSAADVVGREKAAGFSTDEVADIQKKMKQAGSLRKEVNRLHNEMIQMKESLSYFKPSGKSSSLLDDVHKKVDDVENQIEQKENQLEELEKEIDQMKRDT